MGKWPLGAPVMLKSGGPRMIVNQDLYAGYVMCTWFNSGKQEEGTFHEDALEPDEGDSGAMTNAR